MTPRPQRPVGIRLVIYWCGRMLQLLGLLLIWWALLLLAGTAMLYWSLAAALLFYAGWGCTTWATRPQNAGP
ncbi:MAG: hypothetical protein FJZ47_01920 [Candidatus Tectomicrobia bacterium]|uniref:Uncharacterized protein n=1 Tax=Tectimicrobiota bacterium TaxID=2528274 RepID=A0A937VZK9_UNCTE|nr:hypothetical protein [Candidatus Tectomicrobia bacterium]